jgi:hypothetical protein
MRSKQSFPVRIDVRHLIVALLIALGCDVAPVAAQPARPETAPFQSEWLVLGGVGSDVRPLADREVAFHAIEWGRIVIGEHGPGVLRGRLEMMIEVTPVFVVFQSHQAEGAGFSPLMFRWNFGQHRAIHPFLDVGAGVVATNHEVPEGTTRLNFSTHAGGGMRVRLAERWGVVVGYRLHHLSNDNTAPRNPGVTSHVGYMGVAYMR